MSLMRHAKDPDQLSQILDWLAHNALIPMPQLHRLEVDLRRLHGGCYVYIGATPRLQIERRNQLIREARAAGIPTSDIARQFGIRSRRVRQICARDDR